MSFARSVLHCIYRAVSTHLSHLLDAISPLREASTWPTFQKAVGHKPLLARISVGRIRHGRTISAVTGRASRNKSTRACYTYRIGISHVVKEEITTRPPLGKGWRRNTLPYKLLVIDEIRSSRRALMPMMSYRDQRILRDHVLAPLDTFTRHTLRLPVPMQWSTSIRGDTDIGVSGLSLHDETNNV